MTIFWILFSYLVVVAIVFKGDEKKQRLLQTLLGGFGLWLVLALRSPECGGDVLGWDTGGGGYARAFIYVFSKNFNQIISGEGMFSFEKGWLILNKIISLFTHSLQIYLAILAAIQLILIGITLYKECDNIIFGYLIYACLGLYIFSFSGLRQATAIAITFYALNFINEKIPIKFILLTLLASTLHSSAIIFLIAILFRNLYLTKMKGILCMSVLIGFIPFLGIITNTLTSYLFNNRYQNYGDQGGAITMFIIYSLMFIGSYFLYSAKDQKISVLRNFAYLSSVFQSLGFISRGAMTRINYYFSMTYSLFIPNLYSKISNPTIKFVLTVVTGLILILFFYLTNKDGYLNVVPYKFYWESTGYY